MTPDELRGAIIHELDGMVSEFIRPNGFGGYDVDYGQLADVVMPVLAEALAERDAKIAELRSLLRARDENLHTEAEGWKDIVAALGAQEAQAKTERDLALWLHAEALAGKDAVMPVVSEALAAKDAEIADLWRRVDALAELLSTQHLRNRALSALLRGMARQTTRWRSAWRRSDRAWAQDRAELARLRERAVVLPAEVKVTDG